MCSDGLHGVLELAQIEQILQKGRTAALEGSCSELIAAAKAAGGPDNVTVVLVRRAD
jgi:serine/threonine protein phosphatase PrpC